MFAVGRQPSSSTPTSPPPPPPAYSASTSPPSPTATSRATAAPPSARRIRSVRDPPRRRLAVGARRSMSRRHFIGRVLVRFDPRARDGDRYRGIRRLRSVRGGRSAATSYTLLTSAALRRRCRALRCHGKAAGSRSHRHRSGASGAEDALRAIRWRPEYHPRPYSFPPGTSSPRLRAVLSAVRHLPSETRISCPFSPPRPPEGSKSAPAFLSSVRLNLLAFQRAPRAGADLARARDEEEGVLVRARLCLINLLYLLTRSHGRRLSIICARPGAAPRRRGSVTAFHSRFPLRRDEVPARWRGGVHVGRRARFTRMLDAARRLPFLRGFLARARFPSRQRPWGSSSAPSGIECCDRISFRSSRVRSVAAAYGRDGSSPHSAPGVVARAMITMHRGGGETPPRRCSR